MLWFKFATGKVSKVPYKRLSLARHTQSSAVEFPKEEPVLTDVQMYPLEKQTKPQMYPLVKQLSRLQEFLAHLIGGVSFCWVNGTH